jgi:hypothetical protein
VIFADCLDMARSALTSIYRVLDSGLIESQSQACGMLAAEK